MATLALIQSGSSVVSEQSPPKWSFKHLLDEMQRYLWRYGTATDIETDPIELLREAYQALDDQEQSFEEEHENDLKRLTQLEEENGKLKAELAATKAKLPPWWKG